jgi:DNA polymerase-1
MTTLDTQKPKIIVYDTETTGLNFMTDKPFLYAIGWVGHVYTFDINKILLRKFFEACKEAQYVFAHNAKYDWHMTLNAGVEIPEEVNLADSMTVARLTQYADDPAGISLKALGMKYVDEDSKFAADVIKKKLNEINKERLKNVKEILKEEKDLPTTVGRLFNAYKSERVQFVEHTYEKWFEFIDSHYSVPNYLDVYKKYPELMQSYAADDVVITLEYLNVALPILNTVDESQTIFNQENELIRVVGELERVGINTDVDYLLSSRLKMLKYKDEIYARLWKLMGKELSSGQHDRIKDVFYDKYDIVMDKCDKDALEDIHEYEVEEATEMANLIIYLRSLDKWLSTYVEGMLDRIIDGRVHTSINNAGAKTGRVSSNYQQQPREALLDLEGTELFHPRRIAINTRDSKTYYFDYSQMELRLQAQYTIDVSGGDKNLCRAFIPLGYTSMFTGEIYDINKDDWSSGEWLLDGKLWEDLHTATTLEAFPDIEFTEQNFKHYRDLGKRCNFLKNYGGGKNALKESLKISDEIAIALDNGYYKAFPMIKDYQYWVEKELYSYGYVENVFGRRYYLQSSNNFYKAYNYLIQGGCADIVKRKEIEVSHWLKENNLLSRMILPVHDEIQIEVVDGEEHIIEEIKGIMENCSEWVKNIPLVCDVEMTNDSWANKKVVKL